MENSVEFLSARDAFEKKAEEIQEKERNIKRSVLSDYIGYKAISMSGDVVAIEHNGDIIHPNDLI